MTNPIQLGGELVQTYPGSERQRSLLGVGCSYVDGPNLDAFARLRVSEPYTLFDSQMNYNALPLFWETVTTTGGSATHFPDMAAVKMVVDGTNNASVVRQTKQYFRYQPGKSQLVLLTFVLGAAAANIRRRVGYFDAANGIFLEQTATGARIVRRTNTSGSPVDNQVEQAAWNIDKLDGTGPSGITLDFTKSQILLIDLEWLGVGRVRVGFVVDGIPHYAHQFLNTNVLSTVYMSTANLPLRYEITRTAAGAGNTEMQQICASVASEGGVEQRFLAFSAANGTTLRAVTATPLPVLAIRVATGFPSGGSLVNRETVSLTNAQIFSEDAPIFYQVLYNPAIADGSWVAVNSTHSGVEYNVTATSFTGGVVIDAGYVPTTSQARAVGFQELATSLVLSNNVAGTAGDTLAVVCVRVGSVSSDVGVALSWKELY